MIFTLIVSPTQVDAESANLKTSFAIGDALLLAGLTATAYIAAYGYERGFCIHFSVPEHFIRVSVEALISSFVSICIFLSLLIWWLDPALNLLSDLNWNKLLHFAFGIHAVFLCLAIPFFVAFGLSWFGVRTFLLLVLIIDVCVALFVGLAYLSYRLFAKKTSGENSTLEQQLAGKERLSVFGLLFKYVDYHYVVMIIALPIIYAVAWLAGIREARSERFFSLIPSKNLIIIRNYGDLYVCKPLSTAAPDNLAATTIVLKSDHLSGVPIVSKVFSKPPSVEHP